MMDRYIQLNNQIISRKLTQSLLCTPTYTTLVRDWIRTGLLEAYYQPLKFSASKSLPSHLSPTVPEHTLADRP